jgi:hypothetical protein
MGKLGIYIQPIFVFTLSCCNSQVGTMDNPQSPNTEPSQSLAATILNNERCHQRFTLPATANHESLEVSYAEFGCDPGEDPSTTPTILFIPGMFSSRYTAIYPMHAMGQKLGVRVLAIDR